MKRGSTSSRPASVPEYDDLLDGSPPTRKSNVSRVKPRPSRNITSEDELEAPPVRKRHTSATAPAPAPQAAAVKPVDPNSLVSPQALAKRNGVNRSSSHPNDVRIVFFRPQGTILELWANSTVLGEASPYLKTLLESDFAEGRKRSAKRRKVEAAAPEADDLRALISAERAAEWDFEDSDDEADEAVSQDRKGKAPSSVSGDHEYHELNPKASYTTYCALLSWLHTGHLTFTPFRTSTSAEANSFRTLAYHQSPLDNPSLPLGTSPKSMYRLAHLLDMPELQKLALAEIRRQLTVENVATSVLFTDLALTYEDIKKVALDYAATYWWKVKGTNGFEEAKAKAQQDREKFALLSLELLERVG